jgi:hypothetical protein
MQVLNAFKSHLTGQVKTSNLNAHTVTTTEGMTSHLKVLDVVFNKQPKTMLPVQGMAAISELPLTAAGNIKQP